MKSLTSSPAPYPNVLFRTVSMVALALTVSEKGQAESHERRVQDIGGRRMFLLCFFSIPPKKLVSLKAVYTVTNILSYKSHL